MSAVFDFKAIARKLNRQEQKAEFEAKNPLPVQPYGWPYAAAVPLVAWIENDDFVKWTNFKI